jgi:hypothetical protein
VNGDQAMIGAAGDGDVVRLSRECVGPVSSTTARCYMQFTFQW